MGYQPHTKKSKKQRFCMELNKSELELIGDAIMCKQLEKNYDEKHNALANDVIIRINDMLNISE